jgi:hypothetical protein
MIDSLWPLITVPLTIFDQARAVVSAPVSAATSLYDYFVGPNVIVQKELKDTLLRNKSSSFLIKEYGLEGCQERMKIAQDYQEYTAYLQEIDRMKKVINLYFLTTKFDAWRIEDVSLLYDYSYIQVYLLYSPNLLQTKITILKDSYNMNLRELLDLAKALAMRNLAGIHNHKIFKISPSGGKKLISDFQNAYTKILHNIAAYPKTPQFSQEQCTRYFLEVQTIYGTTALFLEGGSTVSNIILIHRLASSISAS